MTFIHVLKGNLFTILVAAVKCITLSNMVVITAVDGMNSVISTDLMETPKETYAIT